MSSNSPTETALTAEETVVLGCLRDDGGPMFLPDLCRLINRAWMRFHPTPVAQQDIGPCPWCPLWHNDTSVTGKIKVPDGSLRKVRGVLRGLEQKGLVGQDANKRYQTISLEDRRAQIEWQAYARVEIVTDHVAGKTPQETAARLGVKEKAVRRVITDAQEMLKYERENGYRPSGLTLILANGKQRPEVTPADLTKTKTARRQRTGHE